MTDLFFTPPQLEGFARFFADEVAAGRFPYVDYDADERWHQRLYRDRRLDIWLISWLPTQGTQLHDHGGSSGSFTVLSGTLTETVLSAPLTETVLTGRTTLRDRARPAGDCVSFGPRYVHDVRNTSDEPAVSVHAYSAPLTSMTYYDLRDDEVVTLATLDTDDPETEYAPAGPGILAS